MTRIKTSPRETLRWAADCRSIAVESVGRDYTTSLPPSGQLGSALMSSHYVPNARLRTLVFKTSGEASRHAALIVERARPREQLRRPADRPRPCHRAPRRSACTAN